MTNLPVVPTDTLLKLLLPETATSTSSSPTSLEEALKNYAFFCCSLTVPSSSIQLQHRSRESARRHFLYGLLDRARQLISQQSSERDPDVGEGDDLHMREVSRNNATLTQRLDELASIFLASGLSIPPGGVVGTSEDDTIALVSLSHHSVSTTKALDELLEARMNTTLYLLCLSVQAPSAKIPLFLLALQLLQSTLAPSFYPRLQSFSSKLPVQALQGAYSALMARLAEISLGALTTSGSALDVQQIQLALQILNKLEKTLDPLATRKRWLHHHYKPPDDAIGASSGALNKAGPIVQAQSIGEIAAILQWCLMVRTRIFLCSLAWRFGSDPCTEC